MLVKQVGEEFIEFSKTMGWYSRRKMAAVGSYFEIGKSLVVTVLKARRGTYQKPFLHVGMVFLATVAVVSTPIIVNSYPTSASSSQVLGSTAPSAVLNSATDISSVDTQTIESQKPRRDVIAYEVKGGDTLSSIAKAFSNPALGITMDSASISYLNDFSEEKILKPGDIIKIPPIAGVIVTVKSGDTIYTLAKKFGLSTAQPIVDWPYNTYANDETFALSSGQTLIIPGGKPPEEVTLSTPPPGAINTTPFAGGTGQFMWPTHGVITQYFSWYHPADDIANSIGTPVVAADTGRVSTVLYDNHDYGYHVIINHGNGYSTLYGHLSRIDVTQGQNVTRGQQIGLMGSTGRSTGPHLHFEVRLGANRLNPLTVLK